MRNFVQYLCLFILLFGSCPILSGTDPVIRDKAEAPNHLQEVFKVQDNPASRHQATGVNLARRLVNPNPGIESHLSQKKVSKENPTLIVAGFDHYPTRNDWQRWSDKQVTYVSYLGNRYWLISVAANLRTALNLTEALSFSEFRKSDKVIPKLDNPAQHPEFYDSKMQWVVLDLTLMNSEEATIQMLKGKFHRQGKAFVDNSDGRHLTIVTEPSQIPQIAAMASVLVVAPGSWTQQVLMDGVRPVVKANNVIGKDGHVLTGSQIRMANNEQLGPLFMHEDLWEHHFGFPTVPRMTALAIGNGCLGLSDYSHGQMTAGIMLGNGWQSERNGGAPFAFRGIAPNAVYECFKDPGASAHVSSHSYVSTDLTTDTHWDASIVGDGSIETYHAHVAAGGNSGLERNFLNPEKGYFSIQNNAKNALIVANAQVNGYIHPTSSSGPTFDGRIKPDITAPTRNYRPELDAGFKIEIEKIELMRNGSRLFTWEFDGHLLWHQGWGHTDNIPQFGQLFLEATQTPTGNMLLDMDAKPWGEKWRLSPVVGTQIVPYSHPAGGSQLNFVGHADDVLSIRYRSVTALGGNGLGYFDIRPVWFRSFPPVDVPTWNSQGQHGAVGIGDGQWRTLEVPVGLGLDVNNSGNPYWPDAETWDGFNIQYLGLRFSAVDFQPTTTFPQNYQRSGGTSGASPVVAGAYALAMEHLTKLYHNVDLDDKNRASVFFSGAAQPYGMPFNSTWKAIFVHTARDLDDKQAGPAEVAFPANPDTGVPVSYYAGPDYTTGYGMLNVQSGIDLMTKVADNAPLYDLIETEIGGYQYHTYTLNIPDSFVAGNQGLKFTLAWDDEPAYGAISEIESKLINNLGIIVQDPSGKKYYPWSVDLPYIYDESNGPHVLEPEPIVDKDIVPARRDIPNDRDNLEQVQVDDLDNNQSGTWLIHVVDNGMGAPIIDPQKYTLVFSPWDVTGQCHICPPGWGL